MLAAGYLSAGGSGVLSVEEVEVEAAGAHADVAAAHDAVQAGQPGKVLVDLP